MLLRMLAPALLLTAAIAAPAAAQNAPPAPSRLPGQPPPPAVTAAADLRPLSGSGVTGTVSFNRRGDQVTLTVDLRGLTPGGHDLRFHETGNCSAVDASNVGTGLGTVNADRDGRAQFTAAASGVTLDQGTNAAIGRTVVVYAEPDGPAFTSAGASDGRIACGAVTRRTSER
jgi:Cu-Zn family superoxide dismutase